MTAANLDGGATGHNIAIAATDLHTSQQQHTAPGTWRQHTWSPLHPVYSIQ